MSSAAVEGRADARIHRRVEHVMGMPISLAMRGRYAATPEADRAWQSVINQLREVDQVFSTYREDSVINRLDRGELAPEQCPAEVAEVLQLGREAEQLSAGAFSIMLPSASGRRRLDPSGVVKGWGLQRASQFLGPIGRHRLLPIRRRRHHLPHRRPQPPRVANRHRAPAQPEGVDRGGAHPIRRHSDLRNGSQGCASHRPAYRSGP